MPCSGCGAPQVSPSGSYGAMRRSWCGSAVVSGQCSSDVADGSNWASLAVTFTGTLSAGSTTVTGVAGQIQPEGGWVTAACSGGAGSGLPAETTVLTPQQSGTTPSSVVLDKPATMSCSATFTETDG
jgi:hypothetical protein